MTHGGRIGHTFLPFLISIFYVAMLVAVIIVRSICVTVTPAPLYGYPFLQAAFQVIGAGVLFFPDCMVLGKRIEECFSSRVLGCERLVPKGCCLDFGAVAIFAPVLLSPPPLRVKMSVASQYL